MKRLKIYLAIMVILALGVSAGVTRPVHLFLAGDSTLANKPIFKNAMDTLTGELEPVAWLERGWGQVLPEFFNDNVVVENFAQNGRSTRTFIEQGWWDKTIADVQKGDFVVIQFGHNDCAENKPDRYTTPEQYEANLVKMISEVKAKGGTPVICTSVARRKFDSDGKIVDTHKGYPEIAKKVASEKKVPMVDMQKMTTEWLEGEGEVGSRKYFHKYRAGQSKLFPQGLDDNTHYNKEGATIAASMFVEGIENLGLKALTSQLKSNAKPYVSKTWVSDLGNGKYKNPVLYADYSDPDACYANGKYYMTASSFNCAPGLPILESNDMINWTIVNYALPKVEPYDVFDKTQLGNGIWAPSIRYHDGMFYIYVGDPDRGIMMLKAKDPRGEWSKPVLVKPGVGYIDPCPFWDEDGQAYLVHAYAGSRYHLKSLIVLCRMSPDGTKAISDERIIFDGHVGNGTCEGPKMYKKDDYYYVFFPAGGVATGWQMVIRSKSVFGPYESKKVMAQGSSKINGPHQGAWIETPKGEDWFYHFQDVGTIGRVVHLQPMKWVNGWPVIGVDNDGDGCGEPVETYTKPLVDGKFPITTPAESDEFNDREIGLQWQWYANPKPSWCYIDTEKGCLRLFSDDPAEGYKNMLDVHNMLLQKMPAPEFVATTKLTFNPNLEAKGESCGLAIIGLDYSAITMSKKDNGYELSQVVCKKADKGASETVLATALVENNEIYMRLIVKNSKECTFSYSVDGKKFTNIGEMFIAREGKWIGAKVGIFCKRTNPKNDGGWIDVDWFRMEK